MAFGNMFYRYFTEGRNPLAWMNPDPDPKLDPKNPKKRTGQTKIK